MTTTADAKMNGDVARTAIQFWDTIRAAEVEIRRTAPSSHIGDDRHFAVTVTDRNGAVLSISRPSLIGSQAQVVRGVLNTLGEIPAGVIAITNDPAAGTSHIHDFTVVTPIVDDGETVGYTAGCFHTADFGGDAFGGFNTRAKEIWTEGAVIPPILLGDMGREPDRLTLLAHNTRTPDLFTRDLAATVHGLQTAARLGPSLPSVGPMVNETGERIAEMVDAVQPGTWTTSSTLRHCCTGSATEIRACLELSDGQVLIDFSGSGSAVEGFVNSSFGNTRFAATLPFVDSLAPELVNEGLLQHVTIIAPDSSVVAAPGISATAWGPYSTASVISGLVARLMRDAGLRPNPTETWTLPPRPHFHIEACQNQDCVFHNRWTRTAPELRRPPQY